MSLCPVESKQTRASHSRNIFPWHGVAHLYKTNSSKQTNQLCLELKSDTEMWAPSEYPWPQWMELPES